MRELVVVLMCIVHVFWGCCGSQQKKEHQRDMREIILNVRISFLREDHLKREIFSNEL